MGHMQVMRTIDQSHLELQQTKKNITEMTEEVPDLRIALLKKINGFLRCWPLRLEGTSNKP